MPLTGKYLKYSPEITPEIFTLVWDKLKSTFPDNKIYDWKEGNFDNFKKYEFISIWGLNNGCSVFGINNNPGVGVDKETTVQEILGYDPFIKEVIPEYVECIGLLESKVQGWSNYYTIGKIYKNNFTNNNGFIYVIGDDGEEWACEISQFKPSTKEAFDAQNQPKQPLKQAVYCETQEEWDFACDKYNKTDVVKRQFGKDYNSFNYNNKFSGWTTSENFIKQGYQILSFQEWCDLNGYKMEKEVKFEVGKWYKLNNCWWAKFHSLKGNSFYMSELITAGFKYEKRNPGNPANTDLDLNNTVVLASIEEIQQYLPDNHPDKIKSNQEFKVGDYIFVMIKGKNFGDILKVTDSFIEKKSNYSGVWINHKPSSFGGGGFRLNGNGYIYGKDVRHATPEEINNHLISIGQIPAGEPLNIGIEPNKDGMFKYKTVPGTSWSSGTIQNHLEAMIPTTGNCYNKDFATSYIPIKPKMILSIDNEELPMVQIKQTNTIKQLLNN